MTAVERQRRRRERLRTKKASDKGLLSRNEYGHYIALGLICRALIVECGRGRASNPAEAADWLLNLHSGLAQSVKGAKISGILAADQDAIKAIAEDALKFVFEGIGISGGN